MNRKGFTLIELLIIIAIIGFLAAAILVAVDPVKRIKDSRDARRSAETNAILNAILKKQVDDRELFSGSTTAPIITATSLADYAQVIVTDVTGIDCTSEATRPGCGAELAPATVGTGTYGCVALLDDGDTINLVPNYIAEMPIDPRGSGVAGPCITGSGCTSVGDLSLGATNTGYYIKRSSGNRIEIGACAPEEAASVSTKR